MHELSVVICTHNPRQDYLEKVLAALQQQTLGFEHWELIMIDNASNTVLAEDIDMTWHPNAYHFREEKLGLTPARLRGIREAQSNLLVFVDDDNVVDACYLEYVLHIDKDFPILGAWGGQTIPEFEVPPPKWTQPYWPALAIREFQGDRWSNLVNQYETTPCGAGMCIRKFVAEHYAELVEKDARRSGMGRKGKKLTSYEDSDMAFTACDLGLGMGRFERLKLKHLMPAERLQEDYLLRLIEASTYSSVIVESYRDKFPPPSKSRLGQLADWIRFWRMSPRDRKFYKAHQQGLRTGLQVITSST
jgi:glycosyltransferase involved in cell wall biosynthesis